MRVCLAQVSVIFRSVFRGCLVDGAVYKSLWFLFRFGSVCTLWIDCLVWMCMCASARSCLPLLRLRFVSFWGFLAVNWFFFSCRRIILHHAEWLYTLFTTIDRNIVLDYMKSGFPRPFFFACFVIASLSGN